MSELALRLPHPSPPRVPVRLLGDERLVQLAREGDRGAFAGIYERHHQGLYRYCRSLLGSDEDARDALQNTMVKALDALPGEQRDVKLKPWLYRIAHNEAISLLRRRRPTKPLDEAAELPDTNGADAATRERLRTLVDDLAELPDRQRGSLLMRELNGLGFAEIAEAFSTSPAGAKQTVYEARLALQEIEEGREMDCEAIRRQISAQDHRVLRGRKIRGHLRGCASCRDFERGLATRPKQLAFLAPPIPAAAAAGVLQNILGGGGGAAGGGVAGGSLAGSLAMKLGVASIALIAGAGAIDFAENLGDSAGADTTGSGPAIVSSHPGAGAKGDHRDGRASGQGDGSKAFADSRSGSGGRGSHHGNGHGHHGSSRGPSGNSPGPTTNPVEPPSPPTTSGGEANGVPVGPDYGRSVAGSHLPPGVPSESQDQVPDQVPVGGHGAPLNLPGGGSGVPPGQAG